MAELTREQQLAGIPPTKEYILAYDRGEDKSTGEDILKKVLQFIIKKGGTVIRRPVASTIIFTSTELVKYWHDLLMESETLPGIFLVLFEIHPGEVGNPYIRADKSLQQEVLDIAQDLERKNTKGIV